MTATITREIATKVRDIVDAGLVEGVGVAEPGKMCVRAEWLLSYLRDALTDSRWRRFALEYRREFQS